jgi:hypothetical protein
MAFVRYLRQSTQATVTIGPVWATDNGALKSDLAYNASGINCDVYKNGTKADVSLSGSAGNGYFRAGSGEAQYLLTLSTGNTDTIGALRLTLSATGYYMPSHDFVVLSADVYDAMFGNYAPAKAGDKMDLVDAPNSTALVAIRTTMQAAGQTLATLLSRIVGTLKSGNHEPQSGDAYAIVNHATNGNAAIKTAIGGLNNLSSGDVGTAVGTALGSYGTAKTTDLGDIESVTDKLGTMTESDGEGGYRYTETALENAPTGGGGGGSGEADWTELERKQMRYVIGMDGDKTPATGGQIQSLAAAVGSLVGIPTFGVVSPVSEDGKYADLVKSADYVSADGRALSWTSNLWPDLSGATVTLRIETAAGTVEIPCTTSGTHPGAQTVTAEPTAAETEALDAGMSQFQVWATLAGTSHAVPLIRGTATVTAAIPPSA